MGVRGFPSAARTVLCRSGAPAGLWVKEYAVPEQGCADNVTFLKDNPSSRAPTASPSPASQRRTGMASYAADGPGEVEALKYQIARRPK